MEGKTGVVFGLYQSAAKAEEALDYLTAGSFSSSDVSLLMRNVAGFARIAGTLSLLAGMGPLVINGREEFIAGGPIRPELVALFDADSAQSLAHCLTELELPEHDAQLYASRINSQSVLLAVHCSNPVEITKAQTVLRNAGAEAVLATATWGDGEAAARRSG